MPGNKLKPQDLTLKELEEEAAKNVGFYVQPNWRLFNSEKLKSENDKIKDIPVKQGLLSQPSCQKDKDACNVKLSPSELFKIKVSKCLEDSNCAMKLF